MELSIYPTEEQPGNASTEALLKALFRAIHTKESGTYFVVTEKNKSAQIVIANGYMLGIGHAGLSGSEALTQVLSSPEIRFSFTPDLIFPLPQALPEAESGHLLEQLGYSGFIQAIEHQARLRREAARARRVETAAATNTGLEGPQRVYRGQRIHVEPESHADAIKQQRTYRGLRIFSE